MVFNQRLRKLREEKDVKQIDVAKVIGVHERTYGYYEENRFPKDPVILQKLAEYFNVHILYLLGISENRDGESLPNSQYQIGFVNVGGKLISEKKLKKIIEFAELSGLLDDK